MTPDLLHGLAAGFAHPLTGLDHVLAMVAVGLWGAQLGAPAIWLLPVTFPMVMAFGGFLSLLGVPLPGVEAGIALSAVAGREPRKGFRRSNSVHQGTISPGRKKSCGGAL